MRKLCRVRMEAAMAMGGCALLMDDSSVMDKLIKFYHDRCYDPDTHRPKQHYFENVSEQLVNQVGILLRHWPLHEII
jgi:hypothetical protein